MLKHPIDPHAPSRPEATDKEYTIKKLVHITLIYHMERWKQ